MAVRPRAPSSRTPLITMLHSGDPGAPRLDMSGALAAIAAVPGLMMLILLAAFNNLLAGVFMALMDAYGLELVSVEAWGLLWGFISLAFIGGGVYVARNGLGPRPLPRRRRWSRSPGSSARG